MKRTYQIREARILTSALMALAGPAYSAESDPPVFHYDRDGVAISVPTGWTEIPAAILKDYTDKLARLQPNAPRQEFQGGFQLTSAEQWFTYPYVMIQIRNTGRVPEGQFTKSAGIHGAAEKGLKKAESQLSTILSESKLTEPRYDPQKHALFMNGSMNVAGVGKVRMTSATLLSEKGTISVYCYALEGDFAAYLKPFETMLNSVELSEELRYKPRPSDTNAVLGFLERVGSGALRGAIIGAIVGLVIFVMRRKNAVT